MLPGSQISPRIACSAGQPCLGCSGVGDAQLSAPPGLSVVFAAGRCRFFLPHLHLPLLLSVPGCQCSPGWTSAGSTAQLLQLSRVGLVSPACSPGSSQHLLALALFWETKAGSILRWAVPNCLFPTCSFKQLLPAKTSVAFLCQSSRSVPQVCRWWGGVALWGTNLN